MYGLSDTFLLSNNLHTKKDEIRWSEENFHVWTAIKKKSYSLTFDFFLKFHELGLKVMVLPHFQQYFSYIMEETGVPGENHWPVASDWQTS